LIAQADAIIIAAGAGMGWILVCLIFAGTQVSGAPTNADQLFQYAQGGDNLVNAATKVALR